MNHSHLNIVILGHSITSACDEQPGAIYRRLLSGLIARGHYVLFLERGRIGRPDRGVSGFPGELSDYPEAGLAFYSDLSELKERFAYEVREADLVIVGSALAEGLAIGEWATSTAKGVAAFYDFDTPATLSGLRDGCFKDLSASLIKQYDLYLSLTGGPALEALGTRYGGLLARPLYCSVDPEIYYPDPIETQWDLGYRNAGGDDCRSQLAVWMGELAAGCRQLRMVVAGSCCRPAGEWPSNIEWMVQPNPAEERRFYNAQRYAINLTGPELRAAGYSPGARLFEAAACAVPVISDWWPGLETFFRPGEEILIARTPDDVLRYLRELSEEERMMIGERAWVRVLTRHTAAHRAIELETYARSSLRRHACVAV
jgi:spore maturation protein CgeB